MTPGERDLTQKLRLQAFLMRVRLAYVQEDLDRVFAIVCQMNEAGFTKEADVILSSIMLRYLATLAIDTMPLAEHGWPLHTWS